MARLRLRTEGMNATPSGSDPTTEGHSKEENNEHATEEA